MDSPNPDHRGGVPAHQYPAVQHSQRGEPVLKARQGDISAPPTTLPERGPDADDDRVRHRLHQARLTAELGRQTHLRGVLAGDDRVHPGANPGGSAGLARGFSACFDQLVLRGAVGRPFTNRSFLDPRPRRRDSWLNSPVKNWLAGTTRPRTIFNRLEPARGKDVEGIHQRARPGSSATGLIPLPAAQGQVSTRPFRGRSPSSKPKRRTRRSARTSPFIENRA